MLLWLLIGPGILVMLGENDGPSMISYATTGATYGVGFFLPFIALTFAMAFVVQEMTVRLGAATKRGHAELIYTRFGRFWVCWLLGTSVREIGDMDLYVLSCHSSHRHKDRHLLWNVRTAKPTLNEPATRSLGNQAKGWRLIFVRRSRTNRKRHMRHQVDITI